MTGRDLHRAVCGLHVETKRKLDELAEYYGVYSGRLDEHVLRKLAVIRDARSWPEAEQLAKRALDSGLLDCLYLWAKRKARGPATPENLERQARRAESLAASLERMGKNARPQWKRAAQLRQELARVANG